MPAQDASLVPSLDIELTEAERSAAGNERAPAVRAARLDRRARNELVGLLALLLVTLAVSLLRGQDVFVFAYIMTVVVVVGGPRRHGRPWSDIGVKPGFIDDLRQVWPLAVLVAVVFQVLPP